MARARNIKPGFFKNYELADQGPLAQVLFAGLWCLADREGRLEDKPRLIKAEIFPYYDCDVNGELTKLQRLNLISRYEVDGLMVIQVLNFKKHQTPHNTEKASTLPAEPEQTGPQPNAGAVNGESTVNPPKSNGGNPPDSLIPDSLIPDSSKGASRKRSASFDPREIEIPEWLDRSAWVLWCDARAEQKKPIGKIAATQQLEKLATYREQGHSPTEVIKHSIAGSFQGLYAPNKPRVSPGHSTTGLEDPDTKAAIEKMAMLKGLPEWDGMEQFPIFADRVRKAPMPRAFTLDQLQKRNPTNQRTEA